jgi:hypothetical protein
MDAAGVLSIENRKRIEGLNDSGFYVATEEGVTGVLLPPPLRSLLRIINHE